MFEELRQHQQITDAPELDIVNKSFKSMKKADLVAFHRKVAEVLQNIRT